MESINEALSSIRRAYRVKDGTFASIKAREPGDPTKGKQADIALSKWGYSGQPLSQEAREYMVGPMTPDFYNQPIGSTQAQPTVQPGPPSGGASALVESMFGGATPQPMTAPSPQPSPTGTDASTLVESMFAGAGAR